MSHLQPKNREPQSGENKNPTATAQPPAKMATARKETWFHLVASSARSVLLAADFTGWNKAPLKMVRGSGGIWNIKVALAPGRYRYRFLVDFGGNNSAQSGIMPRLPFGALQGEVEVAI